MKGLSTVLALLVLLLQYQIWFGRAGVGALADLERQQEEQAVINDSLQARNDQLKVDILDLKNGLEAVEERARSDLGMVGDRETFFLIVD